MPFGPIETHPYETIWSEGHEKIILGSIPPFRFTKSEGNKHKKDDDLNFYYGSRDNLLWRLLGEIENLNLRDELAVKKWLFEHRIGIADVIQVCKRKLDPEGNLTANDIDIEILEYRNLDEVLKSSSLKRIICTSHFVKNLFINNYTINDHIEISVIPSPSKAASRAIGKMEEFKKLKREGFDTLSFRKEYYKKIIID